MTTYLIEVDKLLIPALLSLLRLSPVIYAGELAGHKFLITSVRTGETEIFLIDPDTGDAINLTRSPDSEERYPLLLARRQAGGVYLEPQRHL